MTKSHHFIRLQLLKNKGFNPKVIYDIGAYRGDWTQEIKALFPDARFFLFEANEIHRPFLESTCFPCFFSLLGNREQTVTFYSNNSTGDSVLKEQTEYYSHNNCEEKKLLMTTLDNLIKKENLPIPELIKIDVQGAERLVVEGSSELLGKTEAIIMETKILEYNKGAPFAHEMIALMDQLGYSFQDVFECHYLPTGELSEIDILFINKESDLIRKGDLIT